MWVLGLGMKEHFENILNYENSWQRDVRFLPGNWVRIESVRKELGYITDVERLMKGTHSLHQLNSHENGAIGPIGVHPDFFFIFVFFNPRKF